MFFFKSKNKSKDQTDTVKNDKNAAASDETVISVSEDPSLFEVDNLLVSSGYKVFTHDQGRKPLEKSLKANAK